MYIHNIDLHFHAGQERHPDLSVKDYLEYAQSTGRKILGITDHYNLFFPNKPIDKKLLYELGIKGLMRYRKEVEELENSFPNMKLFFAPEISSNDDFNAISSEVIEMSDFFICEPPAVNGNLRENTDAIIKRLNEIAGFIKFSGKQAFLAHPFRQSVNKRVIKKDIEQWITDIEYREHWSDFKEEEINYFFDIDVKEIGKAASKLKIPLEINGNTQLRARSSNLPAVLQMLWTAYKLLLEEGCEFVPGSDLHKFVEAVGKRGQYVPLDCFEALGLAYKDIKFVHKLLEE